MKAAARTWGAIALLSVLAQAGSAQEPQPPKLDLRISSEGWGEASPADIDAGTIRWGHEVSIGYFSQDHTGAIQKGMTAVEWLHQFDPAASRQEIHGLLGQMLFSGEEGLKPTEALSGGETARLLFCRIMLQKPNVLVFDEPTNHLDLESINALNVALQKFPGTVLLVTHDQDLLEEVADHVWSFDSGSIQAFKGPWEEFAVGVK